MVTVYAFEAWDKQTGQMMRQPMKCPLWRIQEIGGYPIDGTAEDVPESNINEEGCYVPDGS